MSNQTNAPHDVRLKELFNKDVLISLLKDCVKADWINDLDTDSLKKARTVLYYRISQKEKPI